MATNDHSFPLAYFITFRTYGTWLHGDPRGSIDRDHNTFRSPLLAPDHRRQSRELRARANPPVTLDPQQQRIVEFTIAEHCNHRDWPIHALAVLSNHVHVVLSAAAKPEAVLTCLKAWSTRRLREAAPTPPLPRVWSHHGSTRYLWAYADLATACAYVTEGQ